MLFLKARSNKNKLFTDTYYEHIEHNMIIICNPDITKYVTIVH